MRWILCMVLLGCQLGPFDDLEKEASLVPLEPPGNYPLGFGGVMAAYTGRTGLGAPISRIVGARGPGSGQVVLSVWDADGLGRGKALTERCDNLTGDVPDCELGASGAMVGLSAWRGNLDCYLTSNVDLVREDDTPTPGEGTLLVMCETSRAVMNVLPVEEVDLGTDLAALPASHGAGVALISATKTPEGGQLYRLEDGGAMPVGIPNPVGGPTLTADAALGSPLETHAVDSFVGLDQPVVVAAGAPGDNRVVLMMLGLNGGITELQTLGCIDGVTTRAPRDPDGGGIALGNIDGDPALEVIVGDPANDRVLIAEVPTTAGTCDTPLATTELACPDGATGTPDVSCTAAEFGNALAAGDVNGDGIDDLLVGAPKSTVGGDVEAGALYVIPGASGGLDAAGARVLVPSSVGAEDELGRAVEVAVTRPEEAERLEPAVAAPGKNAIFVFLCTGLPGDTAVEGDRCLP